MGAGRAVEVVRLADLTPADVASLLTGLRRALDGTGPALFPVPPGPPGDALVAAALLDDPDHPVDDGTALLLPTSGSTSTPKIVELGAAALLAGARATHARIGSPARWALALPLTHIAGWQVLVRGLLADDPRDRVPLLVPLDDGFTSAGLAASLDLAGGDDDAGPVRYLSLVPTQLSRVLADTDATAALASLDTVLLGGSATPEPLHRKAIQAGIRAVRAYGATETCGGSVYDGVPLDGVEARVSDDGRLWLAGPVLATRYRGDPDLTAASFAELDGRRWYATDDRALISNDGRVTITGRLDDVIVTGGEKVTPAAVEAALGEFPSVREAVVVGVPDPEWGAVVVALIRLDGGSAPAQDPDLVGGLRELVATTLGRHAAPRHVLVVDEVPTRGIGKPDRAAAALIAADYVSALGQR